METCRRRCLVANRATLPQDGEGPSRTREVAELSEAEEAALLDQLAGASPLAQLMFATKVMSMRIPPNLQSTNLRVSCGARC